MQQQLTTYRRELHRIPELKFNLPKTKAYCLNALRGIQAEIEELAESGFTVYFDLNKGDTVAFRTDMDGLPIKEQTACSYQSTHASTMHACGHDGHMAMMLVFAHYVNEHLSEFPHNVLLIFQPAEESGGGGEGIADSGTLERHHVKAIYALHVDPRLEIGQIGSRPGAFMARASEVWLNVIGKSAHVARSEEGIDAMGAGVEFYRRVTEMERSFNSEERKSLKFGLLHSGDAVNIISNSTCLGGTMRTYARSDYEYLRRRILEIAAEIQAQTGATLSVDVEDGYPPVINDHLLFEQAKTALSDLSFVTFDSPSLLGEDFSYYLQRVPGLMLYVGLGHVDPLHAPTFDFDERALMTGVEVYQRLVML